MATKRHKPEEIVTKLRQVEVLVGQGMARICAAQKADAMLERGNPDGERVQGWINFGMVQSHLRLLSS
jgi:hypothetical protein